LLKPYTLEETKKILEERIEHAFQPNVVSDELLSIVAKTASHTGDIRLGFSILLSAGLVAEVAGKSKIDAEDIQAAVKSETRLETLRKLEEIDKQVSGFEKKRTKTRSSLGACRCTADVSQLKG
jgi:Cdc6-like AAA superfamily ATPase